MKSFVNLSRKGFLANSMMTRIAPTPSGYLHAGNALNMLLIARIARQADMRILLRIDDMDADRKRPEYVADIFHTLDWLQIQVDLGPSGPDDFEQHWSQHRRMELYHSQLAKLTATGRVFGCTHSRAQIGAASIDRQYPISLRAGAVPLSTPDAPWRLRTDPGEPGNFLSFNPLTPAHAQAAPIPDVFQTMRDFVIRRRDGLPAYQVCSVADDGHFGVTHVVRGADLRPSTAAQTLLMQLTGQASPAFWHHPLIAGPDGNKLSKSAGAVALHTNRTEELRAWLEAKVEEVLAQAG
jgi:glutamyl-tRNA synthetase